PGQDPVGKLLYLNENEEKPYQVTGVFEPLLGTHLSEFDFFFTLSGKEFWPGEQTNWCCNNYTTYVQLKENAESAFEAKLKSVHDQYFVTYAEQEGEPRLELIKAHHTLVMQKVSKIHLYSAQVFDFLTVSDITTVWAFAAIAVFILLLACINFINLSTANSASRAKEVGLRKAVGSHRKDIIYQFLIEAMVLTVIAVFLGTILASIGMPLFNSITGKTLVFPYGEPLFYLLLLGVTLAIGLLSGLYPSFYLSSFEPIAALSERLGSKGKRANAWLRNILVLFQLIISTMLIAGAISVYRQMDYILTKDVGFDKEQMVIIQGFNSLGDQMQTFKEEVVNLPEVKNATVSSSLPVTGTRRNGNEFWKAGRRGIDKGQGGQFWRTDDDYFSTLGIEFVEGRPFDLDRASDSTSAVINEAMVRKLGLNDPLNSEVENFIPWKIVGVVKDFHYQEFNVSEVRPILIAPGGFGDMLTVKIATEDMSGSIAKLETIWNQFKPNQFFRYDFLDRRYEMMYEGVERTKTLLLIFATFSVIVACLGLFGLSVFTVAQRYKEMTIRKVLGASVQVIIRLLTVDYLKLVVLALIVASPIAYFFMEEWLADFEYKIPRIWDILVLAGFLVLVTCLGVVSMQSFRAAVANPADGLRDE
ncbi:MAG: FtsX-like permease family protein, partial [Bacteroidota bacterium]